MKWRLVYVNLYYERKVVPTCDFTARLVDAPVNFHVNSTNVLGYIVMAKGSWLRFSNIFGYLIVINVRTTTNI